MGPNMTGSWFQIVLYWFLAGLGGCWGWNIASAVAHLLARLFASMG